MYSISSYSASYIVRGACGTAMPAAVSVELTNKCNLHCPGCATGAGILTRPRGYMNVNTAEKIASSLKNYLLSVNLYFQGEPMMHPGFFELAEKFRGMNGIISTNGHFLTRENCKKIAQSGLKKIIISYDGVTDETYSIYRQAGDYGKVKEGICIMANELKAMKKAPGLELLFLIGRHNEHEVNAASEFARTVNASFRIKSMQIPDLSDAEKWIPDDVKKSRYEKKNGKFVAKKTPSRGCIRMWTTAVITWDGNVVPCCYDKDAEYIMGNICNQTFTEIWYGEKRHRFLKEVMQNRTSHNICKQCPQGMKLFF